MRYWTPREIADPPLFTMVVASYLNGDPRRVAALKCLLASLAAQTYPNWRAIVIHDGPCSVPFVPDDNRVIFRCTPGKIGHHGHKYRHPAAMTLKPDGWVGFTNDDNYYMPTYVEWLLSEAIAKKAELVYCNMIHSHKLWKPFTTKPRYRHLDVGGFIARVSLVQRTPWTDFSFKGDGIYINGLAAASKKTIKIDATLFVHN